jgi:hypothetical protein
MHKMQSQVKGQILKNFYRVAWTPEVAAAVLGTLATLCNRFRLEQREIAIAWRNASTNAEGWNRSRVFKTWQEALTSLRQDCLNVNFGALFGSNATTLSEKEGPRYWERQHTFKEGAGTPRGEVVLDIDLDYRSYDRSAVCECGEQRQVCDKCWNRFMVPAQKVMNALMERMGFCKWFAVFSGRRGLHYWICDDQVVNMTAQQRHLFVTALNTPPTIYSDWGREVAQLTGGSVDVLYPKIDVPVGADATHLHGVPLTLHPDTLVFRRVLKRGEIFLLDQRWTVDQLTPDIMKAQTSLLLANIE